jgi:hypothetical protein
MQSHSHRPRPTPKIFGCLSDHGTDKCPAHSHQNFTPIPTPAQRPLFITPSPGKYALNQNDSSSQNPHRIRVSRQLSNLQPKSRTSHK